MRDLLHGRRSLSFSSLVTEIIGHFGSFLDPSTISSFESYSISTGSFCSFLFHAWLGVCTGIFHWTDSRTSIPPPTAFLELSPPAVPAYCFPLSPGFFWTSSCFFVVNPVPPAIEKSPSVRTFQREIGYVFHLPLSMLSELLSISFWTLLLIYIWMSKINFNHNSKLLGGPKVEFPDFDYVYPRLWIKKCENFFIISQTYYSCTLRLFDFVSEWKGGGKLCK